MLGTAFYAAALLADQAPAQSAEATADDNLALARALVGVEGKEQEVIRLINQAIAIDPQYASAYYNRGLVKSDLGDEHGAIADYNQAISINPKEAAVWGARGLVKSQLGDRYGACEATRKSASLGSPVAQVCLPQVCQ